MSLASRSLEIGIRSRVRKAQGTRGGPCAASAFAIKLFCMTDCMRWITRTGHSRCRCTSVKSDSATCPDFSAYCLDALSVQLLVVAFGKDETRLPIVGTVEDN